MVICHACKGKKINSTILGLSDAQATEMHNAVHQREAVCEAIDKLRHIAAEAESAGFTVTAVDLSKIADSLERVDYVD